MGERAAGRGELLPGGGNGYPPLEPGVGGVEAVHFCLPGGVPHLLLHPLPHPGQGVLLHREVPAPTPHFAALSRHFVPVFWSKLEQQNAQWEKGSRQRVLVSGGSLH